MKIAALALTITIPLLMASTISVQADQLRPQSDSGIVLFYTDGPRSESLSGLQDRSVVGGELIAFWSDIEPQEAEYDWSRFDADLAAWGAQGKKLDVRLSTTHNSPNRTPAWVFENYHVRRIGRGYWEDFEKFDSGVSNYEILSAGKLSKDEEVLGEAGAAAGSGGSEKFEEFIKLKRDLYGPGRWSVQWDQQCFNGGRVSCSILPVGSTTQHPLFNYKADRGRRDASNGFEFELESGQRASVVWSVAGGSATIDNINIIRIEEKISHVVDEFSNGSTWWIPGERTDLIAEGEGLEREASENVLTASSGGEHLILLNNNPESLSLDFQKGYLFGFDIEALKTSSIRFRLYSKGNPDAEAHIDQEWTLEPGGRQLIKPYSWHTLPYSDGIAELILGSEGEVRIHMARHMVWSDRVTVFPDYFDPVLQEKWGNFVKAFASRYRNHPALGTISVGGFGRWEEVMLDDDNHGVLDPQWIARGFTQEKYLKLIEHWMDFYREEFPQLPIRICLAYGLQQSNDEDWIYHRVAQAAAKRGIGLKQNGLSEKYDTWNTNTNTSYIYNRYRFEKNVTLTHETGGQIYRNGFDAHGYPLSLLNRMLLNHTDVLFLYGPDIIGRHINKYFHYAKEQMGKALITRFYTYLGDTSLINEHQAQPVNYHNKWLGIRQFNAPGANMKFTTRGGEKCGTTSPGEHLIYFDIDDRWQYEGMHGNVLTIHYWDGGMSPFALKVFDQSSSAWRELGRIKRTGDQAWKMASFADSDWCRSRRNSGEDVHTDIILDDLGSGDLVVKGLEMDFVPAKDWKSQENMPAGDLSDDFEALSPTTITRLVRIPSDSPPPYFVTIPLSAKSLHRSNIVARVFGVRGTEEETCLAEKEYYMAADGDLLQIPFAPLPALDKLRIELVAKEGEVGWRRTKGGDLALGLHSYCTDKKTPIKLVSKSGPHIELDIYDPFFGLSIDQNSVPTSTDLSINLDRYLPDGRWVSICSGQRPYGMGSESTSYYYFEPQPVGKFRISFTSTSKPLTLETGVDITIEPLLLSRRESLPTASPIKRESGVKSWDFQSETEPAPWSPEAPDLVIESAEEKARFISTRGSSAIISSPNLALTASKHDLFYIRLKNVSAGQMVRLFWRDSSAEFSPKNSVHIPVVPNDTEMRDYSYPVGWEEGWSGDIDQLKLQLLPDALTHGKGEIASLAIEREISHLHLDFENSPDSLAPIAGIRGEGKREEGAWHITVTGEEVPILQVPKPYFAFEADKNQELVVRLKNTTNATTARFKWHNLYNSSVSISDALKETTEQSIVFKIMANNSEFQEYRISLDDVPAWKGYIVMLALNPIDEVGIAGDIWIDSLSISTKNIPSNTPVATASLSR